MHGYSPCAEMVHVGESGVRAKIDLFASRGHVLHKHKLETP
ncbi:hypothetical protein HanXRQr2_Chr13g0589871 [Helianthus annuus]|uniref:Uncharacterized protein n=1 Tax=Helianthus annuus TaxID=4232 RepID=A0A9K3EKA1_HELAN|nr:hypothetical protein HanXRQr2_Chr13g0589871 [Helianthus annuus]KAJ0849385.1 hypothetical protein HanPSC8_Chr13g0568181 [Helianthus annuus]